MAELSSILTTAAYYLYFAFGSITFGYLLLRLTYSEIRLRSTEEKLGMSAVAGFIVVILAFAIDFILSGWHNLSSLNGVFPLLAFVLMMLSFFSLKIYFTVNKPALITVGIPFAQDIVVEERIAPANVERISQQERKKDYQKKTVEINAHELAASIMEKKDGKETRKPSVPWIANASGKSFDVTAAKPEKKETGKEKDGKMLPKPFPTTGKQQAMDVEIAHLEIETVTGEAHSEAVSEKKETASAAVHEEKNEAFQVPAEKKPQVKSAEEVAKEREKAIEKLRMLETREEKTGNAPSEEMKTIELETIERKLPREKVDLQISGAPKTDASDSAVGSYAEKRKRLMELAGEIKTEDGKGGAAGAISGAKSTEATVAGVGAGSTTTSAISAGSEKGAGNEIPAFASDKNRVRETLSKARDTEAEAVLNDLLRKTEEEARTVKGDEKGQIVHRRYMLKGGEEGEGVSVFARKETTEKENFDRLVQDVYVQLKSSKKEEKLQDAVGVSAPHQTKPKDSKTEGKAEITFNDLLGAEKEEGAGKAGASGAGGIQTGGSSAGESQGGSSIFSQLENIASGKEKGTSAQSSIEFVKMVGEKGMGCPTCHSNSSRIIFCPYCGTGLCANCSPKIKPEPEGFVYTCPKCKEEINIRKKAMAAAS